jgi:ABC-type Mn2+/Zn2+ transport system permease subunit
VEPILNWLVDPFADPIMVRALAAAVLVGVAVPILGSYVVLGGMAFLGDALAHIILPGVVLASLFDWPLAIGALIVGVLAALTIGAISDRTGLREDSSIGIVFAAAFALGIALISMQQDFTEDLDHILFGDLRGVSEGDLWMMAFLGAAVLTTIFLLYKEFLVLFFDRTLATTMQLPVKALTNLLLVLLAVVIVMSMQAVGVTLVLAMLVTPASSALLLTKRLPIVMLIASLIGVVSGILGLYASHYLDLPSGPAIVLVASAVFGVVFLLAPRRGVLTSRLRRRSTSSDS